jgi:hypothetical protein
VLVGLAAAVLSACSDHPRHLCNAALVAPSVSVDLSTFAKAHPSASGEFCPHGLAADSATQCTSFVVTGGIATTSRPTRYEKPQVVKAYLTMGETTLEASVHFNSSWITTSGPLTGHRDKAGCGAFDYTPFKLRADGVLVHKP